MKKVVGYVLVAGLGFGLGFGSAYMLGQGLGLKAPELHERAAKALKVEVVPVGGASPVPLYGPELVWVRKSYGFSKDGVPGVPSTLWVWTIGKGTSLEQPYFICEIIGEYGPTGPGQYWFRYLCSRRGFEAFRFTFPDGNVGTMYDMHSDTPFPYNVEVPGFWFYILPVEFVPPGSPQTHTCGKCLRPYVVEEVEYGKEYACPHCGEIWTVKSYQELVEEGVIEF